MLEIIMLNRPTASIGQLAESIFTGLSASKLPAGNAGGTNVSFKIVNTRDIEHGVIAPIKQLESIHVPLSSNPEPYKLLTGDIMIVTRGTFKVAKVDSGHLGCLAGPNLIVVRPGPEIDPWLLYAFFSHPVTQEQINKQSVGTTVSATNRNAIARLELRLPEPDSQMKLGRLTALAHHQLILGHQIADLRWQLAQEIVGKECLPWQEN